MTQGSAPRGPDLLFALIFAVAEIVLAFDAVIGGLTLGLMLAAHLGLVMTLSLLARLRHSSGLGFQAVLSALTGPLGAGTGLSLMLAQTIARPPTRAQSEWYATLSGRDFAFRPHLLRDVLRRGRADLPDPAHLVPLADIFAFGSRAERQEALRWLALRDTRKFAVEIRAGLDNADPAIRIQAAALAGRGAEEEQASGSEELH